MSFKSVAHPEECGCHGLWTLSAGMNCVVHQVLDTVILHFLQKATNHLYYHHKAGVRVNQVLLQRPTVKQRY